MPQFRYQLLERLMELYADVDLSDVLLLACQHLLKPQQRMFELLLRAGLKPENCIVVGKNYSTNDKVMEDLKKIGCVVAPFSNEFDALRGFDSWFEGKLDKFITRELCQRPFANYRKIIVLDDGGFMHLAVNTFLHRIPDTVKRLVGIEQTSSGHQKILGASLCFESISVARSHHKLVYESPLIGRNGYERIARHLTMRGKTNPNILVFGLGAIGQQIAGHLLMRKKFRGFATDICGGHWEILEKNGPKHHVGVSQWLHNHRQIIPTPKAMEQIGEFDLIVGTTGSPLFAENEIERLHPQTTLVSMSSSDREFPSLPFRQKDGKVHDDYWLDERCLVNAGFPITFDGRPHAIPPQQIEFTIALLLGRLMDEVSDHEHPLALIIESLRHMWNPHEGADEWYASFID